MGKIKRYKNAVERFLSGEKGQRFFNFAYSIGAAVVIWGALFKILHLPGGNTLLCIGMGTEVLMFMLTAFDRPGRDYHWEEVFPVFNGEEGDGQQPVINHQPVTGSVTTVSTPADAETRAAATMQAGAEHLGELSDLTTATHQYLSQMAGIAEEMRALKDSTEALNRVSVVLLDSYRAITENSENITASSTGYVEQMQALARNVSGLNTIYEIQLKSVSSQLDAIDNVNNGIKEISRMYADTAAKSERYCQETEKMAENMSRLNQVYEKMLYAMTVNMWPQSGAAPQAPAAPAPGQEES